MDVEVMLRERLRPQNCLAGALPQAVPRSSFGWHDCSTCSSFCLAGTMPKAFLTELHECWGSASWAVASSKLPGRSIPKGYLDLPLGWHDCSRCSSFCLAGTMPKAFLTERHGPGGGASWAVASSKLPGRSITEGYLDLPLGWHDCSTCSSFCLAGTRHSWQSPMDLEVVLGGRVRPQNCLAGALPKAT